MSDGGMTDCDFFCMIDMKVVHASAPILARLVFVVSLILLPGAHLLSFDGNLELLGRCCADRRSVGVAPLPAGGHAPDRFS